MLKFPIYLDYSATTPVDPRVAAKMIPWLTEHFGNPASRSHAYGWEAEKAVEDAREQVAALVNADAKEIIWTSGATESNNLAIKGAAHFYQGKGKHIITVKTEHKAVLDTVRELEREGFEATYLDVQENGLIDLEVLRTMDRAVLDDVATSLCRALAEHPDVEGMLAGEPVAVGVIDVRDDRLIYRLRVAVHPGRYYAVRSCWRLLALAAFDDGRLHAPLPANVLRIRPDGPTPA